MRKYEWIDYLVLMLVAISCLTSGIAIGVGLRLPIEQVEQVVAPATPIEVEEPSQRLTYESERATGEGLPPLEERILDELRKELDYSDGEPVEWIMMIRAVKRDEKLPDFFNALATLLDQGKVVRVSDPTPTEGSKWALSAESVSTQNK